MATTPPTPDAKEVISLVPPPPPSYNVGNFSFKVPIKAIAPVVATGALYKKESRPKAGSDEERHLIVAICVDTKSPYRLLSTSKTDPNMLKTTYSLTKLITLTKNHLTKYDLADPWRLVFPMASPNAHALVLNPHGKPQTSDLWTDYHRVTPKQVAASCTFYYTYGDDQHTNIISTLQWSYRHFEKNVESNLFTRINNDFLDYPITSQGGPLFFKLLVDALSVSNDAHLLALQAVVYKYNIKTDCEAEDINDAVAMLKGISENIFSAKDNVLPEQYVHKLLKVFQTTSVPPFNDHFKRLEQELDHAETVREIDRNRLLAMPGTVVITNDLDSSKYIFSYALTSYRKLQANGAWDEHVREAPGASSFNVSGSSSSPFQLICFNCGRKGHKVGDKICELPINQSRINANKKTFNHDKNERLIASQSKWRPPIASEQNKRIIGGNPFSWISTANRWKRDNVPESGLPTTPIPDKAALSGAVVPPVVPIDNSSEIDDATALTSSTTATEMAQMQLQMAALTRRMSELQDKI